MSEARIEAEKEEAMSDHKKIDDKDLEDVTGAAGNLHVQESPEAGNTYRPAPDSGDIPLPPDAGGPGADAPEDGGPSGGNQDLEI